jgi:hypothetical protein
MRERIKTPSIVPEPDSVTTIRPDKHLHSFSANLGRRTHEQHPFCCRTGSRHRQTLDGEKAVQVLVGPYRRNGIGLGGPPGPEGPPGPAGAASTSGTVVRFVDSECRQVCFVACAENERILSFYAINPGGTFTFDADSRKATFRPQRQGVSVKVILACAQN